LLFLVVLFPVALFPLLNILSSLAAAAVEPTILAGVAAGREVLGQLQG
jgi:hypothetical protein